MRIVQIVTQTEEGGAQGVAVRLNDGLIAAGHDSEIWFLYKKRSAFIGHPHVRTLFPRPPQGIEYFTILWRLWKALREGRPDAVISHTHYSNLVGAVAAACVGVRTRIAVHHAPLDTYPKIVRTADSALCFLGFYSCMVAVSNTVLESARGRSSKYRNLMNVVYNGLSPSAAAGTMVDVRAKFGLPNNVKLLLNVGRLAVQKNQGFLFCLLAGLSNTHLIVVGDGELHDELRAQCERMGLTGRVHFLGEIRNEDVQFLLRAADVFVFPSLFEAMPLALLEAMHAGLPIVASDISANREILGDCGILVPMQQDSFVFATLELFGRPEYRESLGAKAQQRAALFTVDRMVKGYELLLSKY